MRIALATQADLWTTEVDDAPLHVALRKRGCLVETPVWDDPEVDWSSYDRVTPRTTWDYVPKIGAFLDWIKRVDGLTRVVNPGPAMVWNLDKGYLKSLEEGGVPCVPTRWVRGPGDVVLEGLVDSGEAAFLKPAVGAGASGTLRFLADDEGLYAARAHVGGGGVFLLQPYLSTVSTMGERSAIVIEGMVTHAVRKLPPQGDYRVQDEHGGTDEIWKLEPAEARLVDQTLTVLGKRFPGVRYARVDWLIHPDGSPRLCELELVEPSLFFRHGPEAPVRFAEMLLDP